MDKKGKRWLLLGFVAVGLVLIGKLGADYFAKRKAEETVKVVFGGGGDYEGSISLLEAAIEVNKKVLMHVDEARAKLGNSEELDRMERDARSMLERNEADLRALKN